MTRDAVNGSQGELMTGTTRRTRTIQLALVPVLVGLTLVSASAASADSEPDRHAASLDAAYEKAGIAVRADLKGTSSMQALREKLGKVDRRWVSGKVLTPTGGPARGAVVMAELHPTSALLGSLREGESAPVISLGRTQTDPSGSFSVSLPLDFTGLDGYVNSKGFSTVTISSFGTDAATSIDISVPSGEAAPVDFAFATTANKGVGVDLAHDGDISLNLIALNLEKLPATTAYSKGVGLLSEPSASAQASSGLRCVPPSVGFADASAWWQYTGSWRDRDSVVQTLHTGKKIKAEYSWSNGSESWFQLAGVAAAGGAETKLGWDLAWSFGHSHKWKVGKNQRKDAAVSYRWRKYQLYCYMPITWEKVKDARTKWIPYEFVGTNKFNSQQPQWTCNPANRTRIATRSVVSRDRTTSVTFSVGTKFSSNLLLGTRQRKTNSHKLTYDAGDSEGFLCGRGAPWPRASEAKEVP